MKLNFKKGAIGISLIAVLLLTAKSFVGQEETPGNSGFKDKVVQSAFEHVGWYNGASWCVFFCKVVWDAALDTERVNYHAQANAQSPAQIMKIHDRAMKLIVGNSQSTLANFTKDTSGLFIVTDSAYPGAIVIFQEYKNGVAKWSGHAGICISTERVNYNTQANAQSPAQRYDFTTIEGNTNLNGSSNGYGVFVKHRRYGTHVTNATNGLVYRKCININFKKLEEITTKTLSALRGTKTIGTVKMKVAA